MEIREDKVRLCRRVLSAILVAVGVIVLFIGLGLDYDNKDEFYQALCVRDYRHSPLAMLSFYVGNVWCRLFSETILHLRQLASVAYLVSIGMASVYLYRQSRNPVLSSAVFLLLSIGARIAGMDIYGWDVGAYPYITAACISVLWYAAKPGTMRICVVGALCALMGLSRIPALSGLPVVLCVIIFRRKSVVPILKDSLAGLASFALVFAVAVFIMVGSIGAYVKAFNPENIISGHSFSEAVERFKYILNVQFCLWMPFVLAFIVAYPVSKMRIGSWKRRVVLLAATMVLAIMTIKFLHYLPWTWIPLGCFQAILYVLLLYMPLYNLMHEKKSAYDPLALLVVLAFAFVAAVGSDGVLERPMAIPLIALAVSVLCKNWNRTLSYFLFVSTVCAAAIFADMRVPSPFGSTGQKNLMAIDAVPRLEGIYCTPERFEAIAPVLKDIQAFQEKKQTPILFVGDGKYMFDYLASSGSGYKLHGFHYNRDEERECEAVADVIDGYETVFVVNAPNGYDSAYPHIERLLVEKGFQKVKEGRRHKIYRRRNGM